MNNNIVPPVILSLSALDPSGCGGIQADIETAASLGCHCASVATSLCTTGSSETSEAIPVDTTLLIEQARSVLEDMPVSAIKVGFVGSVANAEAIHTILEDYRQIPVILQPAFCLWDKDDADQADLPSAIATLLMPRAEVAILSLAEAHTLAHGGDTVEATVQAIMNQGVGYLLLTEASVKEARCQTNLYDKKGLIHNYPWQDGVPSCHGSSSTLASALAAFRAHNSPLQSAVEQAQNFTWQAMAAARQMGFGRPVPHRFFWTDNNNNRPASKLPAGKTAH